MRKSGVLRIHFTAADLTRVKLANSLNSMWEITLSLHLLQNRDLSLIFDPWRNEVMARARQTGLIEALPFLAAINPATHYFPDFLTPATISGDIESGIDALRSTPAHELSSQLSRVASRRAVPSPTRPLAEGDQDAIDYLCRILTQYHDIAVAPYLRTIEHRISHVQANYFRQLAFSGTGELFEALPGFRWRYPVLEADFPYDEDVYLDGRGLRLIPAFFCVRHPVKLFDPDLPPTLVFPVPHEPAWLSRKAHCDRSSSLAQLIGATRASILELIGDRRRLSAAGITEKLRLSPPAVSYHTKILRESGLLESTRDGSAVVHQITRLGSALLCNLPAPA